MAGVILFGAGVVLAAPLPALAADPAPAYIGTVTMAPDGSMSFWLRAQSGATVGHGTVIVRPDDPRYEEFKRHVGGLAPGETKSVPAWPDPEPASDKAGGASQDKDPKRQP